MDEQPAKYPEDFLADDSFAEFVSETNSESKVKWQKWIRENPSTKKEFELAIKMMKVLLKTKKNFSDLKTEEEYAKLLSAIRNENRKETTIGFTSRFQWLRIAAVIIVLLGVGGLFYFLAEKDSADNHKIVYNEIIVPLGEKSQIILSDGTHIWINSSSKLKYPVNFNDKSRTVFLEGEAFFDVVHKEKTPFEVFAPDMKIKVLGTSFNVKNYPGDKKAVTTVVRGVVSVEASQVKPMLIKPNENYVLLTNSDENSPEIGNQNNPENKSTDHILKPVINKKVNVEAITSWKDQMLVFFDETLEDVALKMERWYNVKIHIRDGELKKERYRGKFVNNETIFQVLEAIKFTTPIKYKVENNEFYIDKP